MNGVDSTETACVTAFPRNQMVPNLVALQAMLARIAHLLAEDPAGGQA